MKRRLTPRPAMTPTEQEQELDSLYAYLWETGNREWCDALTALREREKAALIRSADFERMHAEALEEWSNQEGRANEAERRLADAEASGMERAAKVCDEYPFANSASRACASQIRSAITRAKKEWKP